MLFPGIRIAQKCVLLAITYSNSREQKTCDGVLPSCKSMVRNLSIRHSQPHLVSNHRQELPVFVICLRCHAAAGASR